MHKAPLSAFLACNPFPNGWTDGLFYREKMRAIHRVAPDRLRHDNVPPRVLEIGGGRSGLASLLYPGARIVTVDMDPIALGQAPDAATADRICADACALPFADGSFDAVTLFDVLEHIPDDARAALEALRVTRPEGWLLVSTPDRAWRYPYYDFMRPWCPSEGELMRDWGHVRRGYAASALVPLFGAPPERAASFINGLTAFYHDVAFSRLGRRRRLLLYGLGAPLAVAGYLLHRPTGWGTETAFAWCRSHD